MNAAFQSMSDLVADADDLLARIDHSQSPEVRALTDAFELSVRQMKHLFRERVRALRTPARSVLRAVDNPWIYIATGACVALTIVASAHLSRAATRYQTRQDFSG
jgi:ElaB/YqjD/DUF883 family membrane-anchored ribosome-binding protein